MNQLPPAVRQRIYSFAGLERSCAINIPNEASRLKRVKDAAWLIYSMNRHFGSPEVVDYDLPEETVTERYRGSICVRALKLCPEERANTDQRDCNHNALPIQLLQVSRLLREEAAQVLYGRNTIVLGASLDLPQLAYISLTSLEVQLTTCSCVTEHRCRRLKYHRDFFNCVECHTYCKRGPGRPLSVYTKPGRRALRQWAAFCENLKVCRNLKRFTIIADCENAKTAMRVIQPLDGIALLEYVSIRLGQSPDVELTNIAKLAISKLTGICRRNPTFESFSNLPDEIKEMVLSQTDLVIPDYISWNEASNVRGSYSNTSSQTPHPTYRTFSGKLMVCCLQCTLSLDVCACPSRHAGSISTDCNCWAFPSSLLLVSKDIREMAIRIFFSRNKFLLWNEDVSCVRGNPRPSTEAKQILWRMPSDWTANIRWLRFCSKDFSDYYQPGDNRYLDSWKQLAEAVRCRWSTCLQHLTLELDLAYSEDIEFEGRYSLGDQDEAMKSYRRIAMAFRLNMGDERYKDFFIRLAHEVESAEQDRSRWRLEQSLEKEIMGQDYDAASRGKYQDQSFDETLGPEIFNMMQINPE